MPRERFRAAVVQCDCRTHLIIDAGRAIVIRDGSDVELPNSKFDVEVNRFKSMGCTIAYVDVYLQVISAGNRKLLELPSGHVVSI